MITALIPARGGSKRVPLKNVRPLGGRPLVDWSIDTATKSTSIAKTKRVIFVNEDTEVTNFGEHLLRRTIEEHFYSLHARPKLLAGAFVPGVGLADPLEIASVPQASDIERAIRDILNEAP